MKGPQECIDTYLLLLVYLSDFLATLEMNGSDSYRLYWYGIAWTVKSRLKWQKLQIWNLLK